MRLPVESAIRQFFRRKNDTMAIALKRVYEKASPKDGYRVLVDGLWPRGISKDDAALDEWKKAIAPSGDIRKQFHSGAMPWNDFRRRYLSELKVYRSELRDLARRAKQERLTLLFGSNDETRNNAVVVKQYMEMLEV